MALLFWHKFTHAFVYLQISVNTKEKDPDEFHQEVDWESTRNECKGIHNLYIHFYQEKIYLCAWTLTKIKVKNGLIEYTFIFLSGWTASDFNDMFSNTVAHILHYIRRIVL